MTNNEFLQGIKAEEVLKNLGINFTPSSENELLMLCPNPYHHDTKPSMYLNKKDLIFNCFGCDWHGNILTLVSLIKKFTFEQSIEWLKSFGLFDYKQILYNKLYKRIYSKSLQPEENPLYIPPLSDIDLDDKKIIDFFKKRHISFRISKLYGIKVCNVGYYSNRIIIPIFCNQKLYGFEARVIIKTKENEKDKVWYPPKCMIKNIIYDLDQLDLLFNPLYFCEGLMDCLSLKSRGFLNSSCSFGTKITKNQIKILSRFKNIIIVPDGDEGGREFLDTFKKYIKGPKLEYIQLPEKTDIDEIENGNFELVMKEKKTL